MHCPNCGHDNAPTTRFCGGCGGVLVEDAGRGFARRLLRRKPKDRAGPAVATGLAVTEKNRRREWAVALCIALATVALYANHQRNARPPIVVERAELVPLPVSSTTRILHAGFAPTATSVEPPPAPLATNDVGRVERKAAAQGAPAKAHQAVQESYPARDAAVADPAPSRPPEPPQVALATLAAPPADRWSRVRQELDRCDALGILDRVVCTERVRHANCDGHWGEVAACPGAQVVDYPR